MKAVLSLCSVLLLALLAPGVARVFAVAPPALDRARLAALVEQLDDDDYDRRVQADQILRTLGKIPLPYLQREQERHESLEVRHRLEGIIRELTADEQVPELVRLLGERQPDTYEAADYELRRYGKVIVPLLRNELKIASDEDLRQRLERIIADLSSAR